MKNIIIACPGYYHQAVTWQYLLLKKQKIHINEIIIIRNGPVFPKKHRPAQVTWTKAGIENDDELFEIVHSAKNRSDSRLFVNLSGSCPILSRKFSAIAQLLCDNNDMIGDVRRLNGKWNLPMNKQDYYPPVQTIEWVEAPLVRFSPYIDMHYSDNNFRSHFETARQSIMDYSAITLMLSRMDHEIAPLLLTAFYDYPQTKAIANRIENICYPLWLFSQPYLGGKSFKLQQALDSFAELVADIPLALKLKPTKLIASGDKLLFQRILWLMAQNCLKQSKGKTFAISCHKRAKKIFLQIEHDGTPLEENLVIALRNPYQVREKAKVRMAVCRLLTDTINGKIAIVENEKDNIKFRIELQME